MHLQRDVFGLQGPVQSRERRGAGKTVCRRERAYMALHAGRGRKCKVRHQGERSPTSLARMHLSRACAQAGAYGAQAKQRGSVRARSGGRPSDTHECVCVRERGERGEREARGRERVCVEELEERGRFALTYAAAYRVANCLIRRPPIAKRGASTFWVGRCRCLWALRFRTFLLRSFFLFRLLSSSCELRLHQVIEGGA